MDHTKAGSGGMGGMEKPWGHPSPRSKPVKHDVGAAVGEASLSAGVQHLHHEHPHHVQGEGVHHEADKAIHMPISPPIYKGKMAS